VNNPFNRYSLEIYIGEKRSGKTLSMVADVYNMLPKIKKYNYKIYSNFKLNPKYFGKTFPINREILVEMYKEKHKFQKCIFMIDELHIFADSRESQSKENKAIGYLAGQLGKRGVIFLGTTHFFNLVELRLRLYCERRIFIRKGLVINNIFYPILNNNLELTEEENNKLFIKNESIVRKMINYNFKLVSDYEKYIKKKKYFRMYDTEEIIKRE